MTLIDAHRYRPIAFRVPNSLDPVGEPPTEPFPSPIATSYHLFSAQEQRLAPEMPFFRVWLIGARTLWTLLVVFRVPTAGQVYAYHRLWFNQHETFAGSALTDPNERPWTPRRNEVASLERLKDYAFLTAPDWSPGHPGYPEPVQCQGWSWALGTETIPRGYLTERVSGRLAPYSAWSDTALHPTAQDAWQAGIDRYTVVTAPRALELWAV